MSDQQTNDYFIIPLGYYSTLIKDATNLKFNKPYWNGIRIVSPELIATSLEHFPWYGDEMTVKMWGMLHLNIGTLPSNVSVLTKQTGYLYEYNISAKVFTVYDNTGAMVSQTKNIQSIADMKIDFTIADSHQFKVVLGSNANTLKYLIIGHFEKPTYYLKFELENLYGVGNTYFADLSRPYDKDDINNPTYSIMHLATYISILKSQDNFLHLTASGTYLKYTGINKYPIVPIGKVLHNTYFYLDPYKYELAEQIKYKDVPDYDPTDPTKKNCAGQPVKIHDGDTTIIGVIAPKGIKKEDVPEYELKAYKECDTIKINNRYYKCKKNYTATGNFMEEIDNWEEVDSLYDSDYLCTDCGKDCHDGINTDYYLVKHKKDIHWFYKNREYKKDTVIKYKTSNGILTNYLVLQDFKSTDIGTDSKYLNKICDLIIIIKVERLLATELHINFLLPEWSKSLYPKLMPIQKADEFINNRPVYEPWVIWGKYKILVTGDRNTDNDDIGIAVWDLSPSW